MLVACNVVPDRIKRTRARGYTAVVDTTATELNRRRHARVCDARDWPTAARFETQE